MMHIYNVKSPTALLITFIIKNQKSLRVLSWKHKLKEPCLGQTFKTNISPQIPTSKNMNLDTKSKHRFIFKCSLV